MLKQLLLIPAVLCLIGCQTARMQVDPALANVAALPVHGYMPHTLNEPIGFGQWKTSRIEEGWTQQKWIRLLNQRGQEIIGYAKYYKPYRFDVSTPSGTVHVECVIRAKALSRRSAMIDVGMLRKLPPLQCIYDGGFEGALQLLQEFTLAPSESGEVQLESERWQVRSTSRLEGAHVASGSIAGYEVVDGERVIATVEVMNEGRVWMAPTLAPEEQDRVAAVATALLMYRLLYEPLEPERE